MHACLPLGRPAHGGWSEGVEGSAFSGRRNQVRRVGFFLPCPSYCRRVFLEIGLEAEFLKMNGTFLLEMIGKPPFGPRAPQCSLAAEVGALSDTLGRENAEHVLLKAIVWVIRCLIHSSF